jgi:hypothetical protein
MISYILPITSSPGIRQLDTKTSKRFLFDSLHSLTRQSISSWELILVIDIKLYPDFVGSISSHFLDSLKKKRKNGGNPRNINIRSAQFVQ